MKKNVVTGDGYCGAVIRWLFCICEGKQYEYKEKDCHTIIGVEIVIIAAVTIFLFYINSDTVRANRQLELAQWHLLEGDYEQAIAAFQIVKLVAQRGAEAAAVSVIDQAVNAPQQDTVLGEEIFE